MAIRVESPQIQVVLRKMVGVNFETGSQYQGAGGAIDGIDLAPFLGDAGSVRTVKAVDEPCGGFSITFADKQNAEGGDTVYALASPMDQVEIRMARIPVGNSALCPLIMRGFISSIRRVETIAPDGTPQRIVVIQGQDYGKILNNWHVFPEAQLASGNVGMLDLHQLDASIGIRQSVVTAAEWVTSFINSIANDAISRLSAFSGWDIPQFNPVVTVPDSDGFFSASQNMQGFGGGTFWDILEFAADKPWNELWVRDNQDTEAVDIVFRPVPYTDLNGGTIMPGADGVELIPGPPEAGGVWDVGEIVSLDCIRTDHRVANFYWCPPGSSVADTHGGTSLASIAVQPGAADAIMGAMEHDNSNLDLYGLRKMEHEFHRIPDTIPEPGVAKYNTPDVRVAASDATSSFHIRRADLLKQLNWDNSAWESVEIVMKGHETLVPGKFIQWSRGQQRGGGLVSQGYCMRVAHSFTPLRSGSQGAWTTTLTIERSNGFYVRDQLGNSPFDLEGRRGPYLE